MLSHYFIMFYRNILREKSYFLINLLGLSTGLACTVLIYLWVQDELLIDKFHEKSERLYQVMENQDYAGEMMTTESTPGLLAEALKQEIPEVEHAATTTWISPYTLSVGEKNIKADGYHVGVDYFNIFSYRLMDGAPNQVLKDKSGIVISRDLATRLFGKADHVVGRLVELQHKKTLQIAGVFENISRSSSYQFDFVISFEAFKDENPWVLSWGNNGPSTYVTLVAGSNARSVNEKIKDFVKAQNEQSNVSLFLAPYADQYLYGRYENGVQSGGRIEYVRLFSVIAVFILVIACINFMNLSTARATRRAKEVGIKKSVGAARGSLMAQFLSESLATSLCALLLTMMIVWLFIPQFNLITSKEISLDLTNPSLVIPALSIALVAGLLAGSYPALYLSGFKPVAVLKGMATGSWGEVWARRGLVVFQFFLSVVLIVSVIVVYEQMAYMRKKNLGYKNDNLIQFPIEGKVESSLATFLTEVKRMPGVLNASSMGHNLLGRNSNTSGLQWEGKNPEDIILFENVSANYGLIETMGIQMAEGRTFSERYGTDTAKVIFNEAAIRVMNLKDPIGKVVKLWDSDKQIIGVVKDFHFQSLHEVINPLFFLLTPRNTWNVVVSLEGGREKEALEGLAALYSDFNPGFVLDYKFQDQEYAKLYAAEQRVASLSGLFACLAVLISCLGLLGLAAFTAERRVKEIGIRKVLGSSAFGIVMLLSREFTKMVLLSIVLALPFGYWLLSRWLNDFAFHIRLTVIDFAAAGTMALLIAWITVAWQAVKASRVNPVDCLRSE